MRRLLFALLFLGILGAAPPAAFSIKGMVAADHFQASQAGAELLRSGGNAVDAALAATLAAGVVQPAGSGLGGGGFAMVRNKKGEIFSLDFREIAPGNSHRNLFVESDLPKASRVGGLAVAVPGESLGLIELHRRYGSKSLKKIAAPAEKLAKKGFPVGYNLHKSFSAYGEGLLDFVKGFLRMERVPQRGEIIRRRRLAKTIKSWRCSKGQSFVDGWVAKDIVSAVRENGGVMTSADLLKNKPRVREHITGTYRGWAVHSMGPPSSGGLVLMQSLKALEGWELKSMGHNSSELIHLYAEVFQHAFADRANFMGDPDRISVPVKKLLSSQRIEAVRKSYNPEKTLPADAYGAKLDIGKDGGTQHISVIDGDGMMVALTTTINTSFGSRVVGEKSGVLLNNEMDDFVARPGEANAYGLIGSEANAVAPYAVPLSSMSPTLLISPDGAQKISIGASGGPFIISSTLQAIVNIIDFEMDASDAVSRPRIHHQWAPRLLFLDEGFSEDVQTALQAKGHVLKSFPFFSSVQVVIHDPKGQTGASDPRKGGWPDGVGP